MNRIVAFASSYATVASVFPFIKLTTTIPQQSCCYGIKKIFSIPATSVAKKVFDHVTVCLLCDTLLPFIYFISKLLLRDCCMDFVQHFLFRWKPSFRIVESAK